MSNYQHPEDNNLKNLHKSMQYNDSGQPTFRVIQDSSSTVNSNVEFSDSGNISGFGRLRTANTRLLGEFRNMYGTTGPVEIITKFEGSGSQTVNLSETNTTINVTTASGDRALRQSRQYHPYIPGTTNLGFISFVFDTPKANLQQSVGMYDDSNGIFLRMNNTTPEVVLRKGGVDVEVIQQANWNVDSLNGVGDSGITVDFTKAQICVIDYQWLGVGRARIGFNIDGAFYYAHYFNNANSTVEPYSYQPSLPVRWEIKNTDTTDSNSSMMCICYGVYTEGSESETGFENTVSNGNTAVTMATNDPKVTLAVRLRNTVNSKPVRALARLKDWVVFTDQDIRYRILIVQDQSVFTTTPSWTSVPGTGWCEHATNLALTDVTPADTVVLFDGYTSAAGGNKTNTQAGTINNRSAAIYQNYDSTDSMIFLIQVFRLTNQTTTLYSTLNWLEVK